ncbi:MAG: PDZ domain-containing protein [Peptococcaceae bacterium]|nr:PDZ domain-containing protein [Peptococcaceae bacterium]
MYLLTEVVPLVIKSYFLLFLEPEFLFLMAAVTALVALQYRRSEAVRASMFGVKTRGMWRDTLSATLLGLAGGLGGSILIVLAGLPLTGSGTVFVLFLFIAVLLMLINPRFICFAYAGGIISLANIITGLPPVNIYQVLALVAVLHMVESVLIFFSGHLGAVPTFFGDSSGRVLGGFTLQKFWPIPLVALTVAAYPDSRELFGNMPQWWPLIKPGEVEPHVSAGYALVSVVAGLGYGDLAIARSPWEKSRLSAFYLALYSVTLFTLAVLAQDFHFLAPVAALFSPLGHELVICVGRRMELAGRPAFAPSDRGVRVLDVIPDSIAWNMGIRSGDVLITVGGYPVNDRWGLKHALEKVPGSLELEFLRGRGQVYSRGLAFRPDLNRPLGVLVVPAENEKAYVEIDSPGRLAGAMARLWEKIKR